jgi:hypothetical protein
MAGGTATAVRTGRLRRFGPRPIRILLIGALVAGIVPAATLGGGAAGATGLTCPSQLVAPLQFAPPTYIDRNRPGGEPVTIVAQDGSIVVSAHGGTTHLYKDPNAGPGVPEYLASYTNQVLNWRSADGGETWKFTGFTGQTAGPHTVASTGFSDPDLTVFSSPDDGQSWPRGTPVAGTGDRPWLTAADANVLYLYINSTPFHYLQKSTDGGLTYSIVNQSFPAQGKLIVDPLNPHHGLIGPYNDGMAISADDGVTWKSYNGHLGPSVQFFGDALAVDNAGWIYAAAAGGYSGPGDTKPNGSVTFNWFNRTTLKWQDTPLEIPHPEGDALWPWMIAGDDGRAAVVWYQTLPQHPDQFLIYLAETKNAHGSMVKCSDGRKHFVAPQFRVVNAAGRPIHVGDICLQGTACNAATNPQEGDRRLGDFFTVNYDHQGTLYIVSGDTRLPNPVDGPKMLSNPIFIKQSRGTKLLTTPIPSRPTRPLCAPPACVD